MGTINIAGLGTGHIVDYSNKDNKYKIVDKLGSGGNGVAYLVQCIGGALIGNFFTMKFLNRTSQEGKARFLEEIKFIRENNHPSILSHYDEGTYEGYPFVVVEYLRNSLSDVLREATFKDCLVYTVQLLSAVKYLQDNGCVHRDIKPGNIFLDNSNAVLGDFGLIKKVGEQNKDTVEDQEYLRDAMPRNYRTPQLIKYMKTGELSIKTDIFQLGLVIHEIFTKDRCLKNPPGKAAEITPKSFNAYRGVKSEKYGNRVEGLIKRMVTLEEKDMMTVDELLEGFQGILAEYFVDVRDIEFKVLL